MCHPLCTELDWITLCLGILVASAFIAMDFAKWFEAWLRRRQCRRAHRRLGPDVDDFRFKP